MRIDIYHHLIIEPHPGTDLILAAIANLERTMGQKDDELKAAVQAETSAVNSAVTLINGLADKIENAVAEGTVDQAVADLRANAQALGEAVAANTPAG